MNRVVKLTEHGGQYRITLPRELLVKAEMEGVEFMKLTMIVPGRIMIDEYYGKSKEKRDIPEDRA